MRSLNLSSGTPDRRSTTLGLLLFATFSIAGCAHKTSHGDTNDAEKKTWTGRISLQIQTDPPQAFFAGFELNGNPTRGELSLTSPVGSVLGIMRWSPDQAVLESGSGVKRFASVDALLAQTTGAAIPVAALFDWLKGVNTRLSGWSADLSRLNLGRIVATRDEPAPPARLRIVLDQ